MTLQASFSQETEANSSFAHLGETIKRREHVFDFLPYGP